MFKLFLFWKKDYNKGLASVMGVFHKAISKAEKLMAKMEEEMDSNVEKTMLYKTGMHRLRRPIRRLRTLLIT